MRFWKLKVSTLGAYVLVTDAADTKSRLDDAHTRTPRD